MKGIDTLIRLAKRTLDELRKKQVSLETQKAKLEDGIRKLANELATEQKLAEKTPEMGAFYGGFAKRIKERQAVLKEEIKKVEEQLVLISEEILNAFADLKKYEIARDNFNARAKAETARKETIMMDEIAGSQFSRKGKQDGLSLMELSIVMIISSFVIAAIATLGTSTSSQVNLQFAALEIAEFQQALHEFKRKYGMLPGDMPTAQITQNWPDFCATQGDVCHGNANSQVIHVTENVASWTLLRQANYLAAYDINLGAAAGGAPDSALAGSGEYLRSKYEDKLFYFLTYQTVYGMPKNYLAIMNLTPAEAMQVDMNIDNGDPTNGKAKSSGGGVTNKCLTAANDAPSQAYLSMTGAKYDVAIEDANCTLFIDIGL